MSTIFGHFVYALFWRQKSGIFPKKFFIPPDFFFRFFVKKSEISEIFWLPPKKIFDPQKNFWLPPKKILIPKKLFWLPPKKFFWVPPEFFRFKGNSSVFEFCLGRAALTQKVRYLPVQSSIPTAYLVTYDIFE